MKRRLATLAMLIPLLAGCSAPAAPASSESTSAAPEAAPATETATTTAEGAPGLPLGEIPPVPLFEMPDLSMLDTSMAGFSIKVRDKFPSVPGVTIRPARCDKSGQVQTSTGMLELYGNGSGTYTDGNGKTINNYGNGAGDYTNGTITINNYGNGTGDYANTATGESFNIKPQPIMPIAALGTFPRMSALRPIKSCGTRITIDDSVLFDFNKDTLRPTANDTMAKLATVFTELNLHKAVISGHTDAIGTDEYNQDLSERRANRVRQALLDLKVKSTLEAIGYGETRPVAPNSIKGKDNPAGRQANRRVEIFIPDA